MKKLWNCENCETLLGIRRGKSLYIRYKSTQYVVEGGATKISAVCRNCSRLNHIIIPNKTSNSN